MTKENLTPQAREAVSYNYKSPFLKEALARGFIFDCTDPQGLDELALAEPITAYIGYDPTASSLHVGNAMTLMIARLLKKHGHHPIALVGGGTARIGDPSFRDEARSLMTKETINTNLEGIKKSIAQFLDFRDQTDNTVTLVNNADWLNKLSWLDLLEDAGPHFSISRMLSSDSVKQRLEREQGLTFLEFNYSILQGYDFRELARTHNVSLQIGGSDQWGNIVAGIEFARRTDRKKLFGLTVPLLTTSGGKKMGKSASGGTVWVSEDHYPVFDYWQFWRNTEDNDVERFLKLFTDLDVEECERLGRLEGQKINKAKEILATEATAVAHGRQKAEQALEAARKIFASNNGGSNADMPEKTIPLPEGSDEGLPAFKIFALSGLCQSGGEARRLIKGGGAYINEEKVDDENLLISKNDLLSDAGLHLASGKKKHLKLYFKA